jgi:hypothetical protein
LNVNEVEIIYVANIYTIKVGPQLNSLFISTKDFFAETSILNILLEHFRFEKTEIKECFPE